MREYEDDLLFSRKGMEKIETAQRRAARRITGATLNTPGEAVNREAGLEDQRVRYQQMEVQQFEKWSELEEGDPRRELTEREVAQRARKDWREHSRRPHCDILQDTPNPPSPARGPSTWRAVVPGRIVYTQIEKTESSKQQPRAAREALENVGEESATAYIDGSAVEA